MDGELFSHHETYFAFVFISLIEYVKSMMYNLGIYTVLKFLERFTKD